MNSSLGTKPQKHFCLALAICWLTIMACAVPCGAQQLTVTPEKKEGVYAVGEKIRFNVNIAGENASAIKQAHFVLKRNGLTPMHDGDLDLASGSATIETSLDEPGTILAEVTATAGDKKIRVLGGAAIAPEKIQPSSPRPDDFDSFWASKIQQLNAIPANAQLEAANGGSAEVNYFKVTMDNINKTHIYAQFAEPKAEGKFPALLVLQWAGVYGLPKDRVVNNAKKGWMVLNVMPHDLPFDKPADFYRKLGQKELKNYWTLGSNDRETSYFLRMYLSCYRAADFLTSRPEWDGKTLVVMGDSQGGQQTIMLAGLYPKITAAMALVPSSCDVTGPKFGRAAGYPSWADQAKEKNDDKILQTARYFDPVNFASHITCPALVSMGLLDETSPPAGVFSAINQIPGAKEVLVLPNSNHSGDHNAQAPFRHRSDEWLAAIRAGQSVPPGKTENKAN